MNIFCPKCNTQIEGSNISVANNTFLCVNCDEVFVLSEMIDTDEILEIEKSFESPPKGIKINVEHENLIIHIFTHSREAFFLFFFTIVFSTVSFLGLYNVLLRESIIELFLISIFVIISICLISQFVYSLFGKIKLFVGRNESSYIFIGVGIIGYKKYLHWDLIKKITINTENLSEGGIKRRIHIFEGNKIIKISLSFMNEEKRFFLEKSLRYFKKQFAI